MRVDDGDYPSGKDAVDKKRVTRIKLISRLATFTCILMYVSYIAEIYGNFTGNVASPIQPLVAMINACLWTAYGWMKTYKDWPVIIANGPGIVFGFLTFVTVFIH